jgi:hypothetical protein
MLQTTVVETVKIHSLFSIFFLIKLCRVWDNVEKYSTAGQATYDDMTHAHCVLDDQGYRCTLRKCKTYCISTATMITRTRLSITSYVIACLVYLHVSQKFSPTALTNYFYIWRWVCTLWGRNWVVICTFREFRLLSASFVVEKVALGNAFLRVRWCSCPSVIPPVLYAILHSRVFLTRANVWRLGTLKTVMLFRNSLSIG